MSEWIENFNDPYAEDDAKLNDFIEETLHRVSVKLFHHQDRVVYSANETVNYIPRLREGAIDYIGNAIEDELSWVTHYMINRILVAYLSSNIDPGEEGRWWFEDELGEEDAAEFWNEIYDFIWEDYSKHLGEEKTRELWKKWGYPERK